MSFRCIEFEAAKDGVATVTINRPEKRNALNRESIAELESAFETIVGTPEIRGLILTGSGDKAFVAGADVAELASLKPGQAEQVSRYGHKVFRKLETLRKPSVAAIRGMALGGGLELAMCCTVRFATPGALLGQPEVKLGLMPGYGATQRLPRLVGRGRALEMLLSAQPITAEQGLSTGLVNRISKAEDLIRDARDWLLICSKNGAYAMGMTMEAVDFGYECGMEQGFRFESAAFGLVASSEDCAEGTRAFLEKRSPQFTGS